MLTPASSSPDRRAFTLVELLVSVVLIMLLMVVLLQMTDAATRNWTQGQARTDSYQSARSALELLSRELAPAVVDTRMQFVVAGWDVFRGDWKTSVVVGTPVLLWMAPIGEDGRLRCVGYYLARDDAKKSYQLKRIFIAPPEDIRPASYFPRFANLDNPRDATLRTSPVDAAWFMRSWNAAAFDEASDANTAIVSPVSDGIIAFWVQGRDQLGAPIPLLSSAKYHPASKLLFNSAAYFTQATSVPFEDGTSFQYLAQTPQAMKANRLPASLEIAIVTLDPTEIVARSSINVPEQPSVLLPSGALDLEASVAEFTQAAYANGLKSLRVFTTRTKLINGN